MKFAALLLATTTTDAFRLNRGLNRRLPSNAAGMLHNNAYQTCFDREFATAGVSFSSSSFVIYLLPSFFSLGGVLATTQQRNNRRPKDTRILLPPRRPRRLYAICSSSLNYLSETYRCILYSHSFFPPPPPTPLPPASPRSSLGTNVALWQVSKRSATVTPCRPWAGTPWRWLHYRRTATTIL